MVKKAVVGIAVVVIFASLGIGVLIGMQIGGGSTTTPAETTGDTQADGGSDDSGTTDDTNATETPAEGETSTPEETEQQTSVPAREFTGSNISSYVRQYVNEERKDAGLEPLRSDVKTAKELDSMARDHSEGMATAGKTVHTIDNQSTSDRYDANDLTDKCTYQPPGKQAVEEPDKEFEIIGRTVAGQTYEEDGQEKFHGTDREVARKIVNDWMDSVVYRDRVLTEGVTRFGVGTRVTNTGYVYVTVDLCG